MKRLIFLFAVLPVCALPAVATDSAPLTTLRAVAALSNAQASKHLPASFEATVTYYARNLNSLDVQDGDVAIYVSLTKDASLLPGDRIRVEGTTQPSFLPFVLSNKVTLLGHGALPKPFAATFEDLVGTKINCRFIRVHGIIRAADLVSSPIVPKARLQLLIEGGYIDLEVESSDANTLKSLLDAEVEVLGAAGRIFDGKMQEIGAKIKVSSLADIKVLHHAGESPWALPLTPLDGIITGYDVQDLSTRLRVHGTITWYRPGEAVVLQSGDKSLWVSTRSSEPLQVGDIADATGFPEAHDGHLLLNHAEIKDSHVQAPIPPQPATWHQLAFWGRSKLGGRQYDLESIDGIVVAEVREGSQDEYVLVADGRHFTAVYDHPPPPTPPPPMLKVPLGSRIKVTGICMPLDVDPLNEEAPFNILLRSFSDIQVIARPTPLNVRNLMILAAALLVAVFAVGAWNWYLERKRRHETTALAYLERRRSLVLEDLNGSRPLKEVIEQITDLVSFKLQGAASWCEIKDGPSFGQHPDVITSQRVVFKEIHGRSGVFLGTLFAALPSFVKPGPDESAALALGTGLAKLAIETSNLYQAMVYRSEFDLLTDIPNRFSLEKQMETLIHEARSSGRVFGFVFIDLDRFKEINDRYGHQAGDVYLQEVARRMKKQLRPGDMLARLGGDEFAVIVQSVRNRTEVEEIAERLEHCFDESFAVEGGQIFGSASVGIALYPENATNRDGLLSTADAAMYVAKQARKRAAA